MDQNFDVNPRLIAAVFATQATLNWLYVLWVKAQPIINNAWFVVLPLIGFFYFAFVIIACAWIFTRKSIGLNFAYCVLMAGAALDILSYSLVYQFETLVEALILPLMLLNFLVIFYLMSKQKYFSSN